MLYSLSAVRGGVTLMLWSGASSYGLVNEQMIAEQERSRLIWQTCLSGVSAAFCMMLVSGVTREAPCLVMSYLVYFFLLDMVATIALLYAFYDVTPLLSVKQQETIQKQGNGPETVRLIIILTICVFLALVGFFWYLWLVVFSFYRELTGSHGPAAAQAGTWSDGPAAAPPGTWNAKQDGRQQMPMV